AVPRERCGYEADACGQGQACLRHGCAVDEHLASRDRRNRNACSRHCRLGSEQVTARAAATGFKQKGRARSGVLFLAFSLALLLLALWLGAAIGETAIPLDVVAKTVANRVWNAGYPLDPIDEGIIWSYRLSRAVIAACCGASLAISGVILQSLLRNSLADPYILGISAGASTGAVAVAILGIGAGVLTLSLGA